MGKTKSTIQMKGGKLPEDCLTFTSYVLSFVVFIMAIFTIYNTSVSLFGIILLYMINIIYSILLAKDLFSFPKIDISPSIVFILSAVLGLNIASSTVVMLTIRKINADHAKENKKMELSQKSRNTLSIYIAGWIFTIIMVWILSGFYFIEPIDKSFFSYEFIGQEVSPLLVLIGFIIKSGLSLVAMAISGYMVYKAKQFSDIKTKLLIVRIFIFNYD